MLPNSLRVAFVINTLTQGGAEKQLLYMAKALKESGVEVRGYCPYEGEFYTQTFRDLDIPLVSFGKSSGRAMRFVELSRKLREFKPHVAQATHFHSNMYAAAAGRAAGALTIGAIRSNGTAEVASGGLFKQQQLKWPHVLIANSQAAKHSVQALGAKSDRVFILQNVIDLEDFDRKSSKPAGLKPPGKIIIFAAGRLVPAKRFDRFIRVIHSLSKENPRILGLLAGEGPLRGELTAQIKSLGMDESKIRLLGARPDVPAILAEADIYLLTSDEEGFPNVVMESMAASKPVIMTPVGDATSFITQGLNGYIVDFDDLGEMSARISQLADSEDRRTEIGAAARKHVEDCYAYDALSGNLLSIYRKCAEICAHEGLKKVLPKTP